VAPPRPRHSDGCVCKSTQEEAIFQLGAWAVFVLVLDCLIALLVWGQVPSGAKLWVLLLPLAPLYILGLPLLGQPAAPPILLGLAAAALVSPALYVLRPSALTRSLAILGLTSWLLCTFATCGALV
jgi:hypothetical protein